MKKLKSNGGFSGVDIAISLGIIAITLVILSALYLNSYITNAEIERRTTAINYISQIFEKVSENYYSDVNEETFAVVTNVYGKDEIAGVVIQKGYNVTVNIENYKTDEETDVVKNVTVSVTYKVGKKDNTITLSKYKTKEVLITPNVPVLKENLVAVKEQKTGSTSTYKTTSVSDTEWYNYYEGKFALAKDVNATGTITSSDLYVWIPRYAYYIDSKSNLSIRFLYSNKDEYVTQNGTLEDKTYQYIVDDKFAGTDEKGYWIQLSKISTDTTANRLYTADYEDILY